jgi:hypothetical protein
VWAGGHERTKRQAEQQGLEFTALAGGFASCTDPAGLQAICDRLGPADLQAFFDRWMDRIPLCYERRCLGGEVGLEGCDHRGDIGGVGLFSA